MPKPARLKLYRKQLEFCQSAAPTVTFQGGAGSGKTRAGCAKALLFALKHPESRGMVIGASYPSLKQAILPHLEAVAGELGLRSCWSVNRADNQIALPNGSSFWLRSADNPESLLGADLSWCWGDEPATWKHDAYRYLVGRLRQPGFPHQAFFTFTPKGRNWAAVELCNPRDGLEIIKATSLDNPFTDYEYRERLRREYGEGSQWWRQEVLGEVVAFEGLVYPQFAAETCVQKPPSAEEFTGWFAGVDWGWTNPGVILLGGLHKDGALWIVREWYETERTLEWWLNIAQGITGTLKPRAFDCDPSEPGNIDSFAKAGLAARKANNAIIPGITAVAGKFAAQELFIAPACPHLIEELSGYCWKRQKDGEIKRDEPDKVHDHACDALRYLVMGQLEPDPFPSWMF